MNIALLGNGKTGSRVEHLAKLSDHQVTVYNSTSTPKANQLVKHDIIISFVPGKAFLEWMPMLLESGVPVVSGSTGFQWPGSWAETNKKVRENTSIWVHSGNFSIGCGLVLKLLKELRNQPEIHNFTMNLTETHHVHKIDAPSGTALLWKDALGFDVQIKSVREADIKGIHELILSNDFESITIGHEVTNRDVFAKGALQTAEFIHKNKSTIDSGLYDLQQLMMKYKHLY
ncbi:MAG TPA: hypothetical protein DCE78_07875 [Bacteroidetes bacterium]|nr:hypothetical protein [Bacteroidota bacterium]